MTNIVISGSLGRMGKRIAALAIEDSDIRIVGAIEAKGHPGLNKDVGTESGLDAIGIKISDDPKPFLKKGVVLIEFSTPLAVDGHLKSARSAGSGMVIGTTGLNDKQLKVISDASKSIPIVAAPNMSLGINLLFRIAGDLARTLGDDYDVEIVEAHHRFKKDAPSGTAKRFAEIISNAREVPLKDKGVYGRRGDVGQRPKGEIGIHAVRAGDIVGDHTIVFATPGERIELTHKAQSRDAFAMGAILAAKFVARKASGLFDMNDVLGSR
ncbi:MAG: 4-hydroxy-tetrahydrodipicolinate reductase [Candidatus Omnitrophica bacterium]|nr:4-hydroxy-tetrahydrodipicolinate reductase [Candidatus Omnitrophota bacterium]